MVPGVLSGDSLNFGNYSYKLGPVGNEFSHYESYVAQVNFCGNCINDSKMEKRAKTKQITVLQIAEFHGTLKALLILQL